MSNKRVMTKCSLNSLNALDNPEALTPVLCLCCGICASSFFNQTIFYVVPWLSQKSLCGSPSRHPHCQIMLQGQQKRSLPFPHAMPHGASRPILLACQPKGKEKGDWYDMHKWVWTGCNFSVKHIRLRSWPSSPKHRMFWRWWEQQHSIPLGSRHSVVREASWE